MNQEPLDPALEELIEATTQQILLSCQPGTTSDSFTMLLQLLLNFLQAAQELEHENAIRYQWDDERAQQN